MPLPTRTRPHEARISSRRPHHRIPGCPTNSAAQSTSTSFVGHPAYGLARLRGDLERFAFLLGGSDGEQLFGP